MQDGSTVYADVLGIWVYGCVWAYGSNAQWCLSVWALGTGVRVSRCMRGACVVYKCVCGWVCWCTGVWVRACMDMWGMVLPVHADVLGTWVYSVTVYRRIACMIVRVYRCTGV